jgi:Uma2 family endonuclease
MATSALISAREYLATSYRPDCDFVDGEVQERNLGELDHGNLQFAVAKLLDKMRVEWHIRVTPELRIQVREDRFRVPDVCVISANAPKEQVVRHPPLLCIEILSPEDTIARMRDRIADFIGMGVPQVWLLDPATRTAIVCDGVAMVEHKGGELILPGTPVRLNLAEAFAVLDE